MPSEDFPSQTARSLENLVSLLVELELLDAPTSSSVPKDASTTVDVLFEDVSASDNLAQEEVKSAEVTHDADVLDQAMTSSHQETDPSESPGSPDQVNSESSETSLQRFDQLTTAIESLAEEVAEDLPESQLGERTTATQTEGDGEMTQVSQLLLPLIAEMLQVNADKKEWQDTLFQILVPVIDQIIQRRSRQNHQAMSVALATLIPEAIAQEIQHHPRQVARAIAPEIAIAIQEQIRLDRDAIANALASEMGRAIKAQIELERDAMVDALYPVIGNTISKYMVEFVRSINEKLERTLTPEAIQRKVRAKLQGIPEEELIFRESLPLIVQAVFLIHKASGLVMADVQPPDAHRLEADMLAGMLSAIRSFVNDCIAREGDVLELSEIESGDSKIIIESAGYCYIAVVVKGEPSKDFIQKMRNRFAGIVQKHHRLIEAYAGDPRVIPESVLTALEAIRTYTERKEEQQTSKFPWFLLLVLAILLGIIISPIAFFLYRGWRIEKLEQQVAIALDATPELSIYRLIPDYQNGKLVLSGKVPNLYFKSRAEQIAQATLPDREIVNDIIAVDVPPDPVLTQTELKRVSKLLNQEEGVEINTIYNQGEVVVEGTATQTQQIEKVTDALAAIPGINSVVSTVQIQPPTLDTRVYFKPGSTTINQTDLGTKIATVVRYLNLYPDIHLRIVGYTDSMGSATDDSRLALQRANAVKQVLEARGISPTRLQTSGSTEVPPGVRSDQPQWLQRLVLFDPYLPKVNQP